MTPTAARPKGSDGSHWYYPDGKPAYEIAKKDGSGMRPTTLADARKLNLLPSVTTILKVLHKQALVEWICEQTALAVLTTPKLPGEALDAFVYRVLHSEKVQDQEAQAARDRGTEIHDAMEKLFMGQSVSPEILPWVEPAFKAIRERGEVGAVEACLVGEGYAGKTDLIQVKEFAAFLWDWKTTKKLPQKGAWSEHKLQLSAYAAAYEGQVAGTGNVYISTVEQGQFVIWAHEEPWRETYEQGFEPLVQHWQWSTGYKP